MEKQPQAADFPPRVLHADPEHAGLRAAVLLLIVAGVVLGYWLILALVSLLGGSAAADYAQLVSCAGGLPLGLALAWLGERMLKRVWHSGQALHLTPDGVTVVQRRGPRLALPLDNDLSLLHWYFRLNEYQRVGNERRAPRSWYCAASALHHGDVQVIVYAFLAPAQLASVTTAAQGDGSFRELNPQDVYERRFGLGRLPGRPEIPPQVLRGASGRYWLAEKRRWQQGLELNGDDYLALLHFLTAQLSNGGSHG